MILIDSTVMSDDNYDDELPQILVNSSCRDSDDFSMPTADVLASQRAREEECEEELRQLRTQYEKQVVRLTSTDSSSSESEGSLAAAVGALSVVCPPADLPPTAADLVCLLATNLAKYNTEFLPSYLEILQTNNEDLIKMATDEIAESIECILMDTLECSKQRSDGEIVVVTSWLWAASMWRAPRVPGLRRLLQAMLALATPHQVEQVSGAVCAAGAALRCAGALVRAADAAAPHALAARARAAALRLLAPCAPPAPPAAADEAVQHVCARLGGAWRALAAGERLAALQLAGRARWPGGADGAGGDSAARAAVRDLLALVAQPPPAQHRHSPEYLKVVVGASKLQILFRTNS